VICLNPARAKIGAEHAAHFSPGIFVGRKLPDIFMAWKSPDVLA